MFLTENTPPLKDTRVRSEATMAVQLGHRVTVIGPSAASTYEEQVVDGITVLGYPLRPSRGGVMGYLREYLSAAAWTARLLTRVRAAGRIDLVHAANPPDFLLLLALPLKLGGTKLVFDHHDLAPELFEAKFGARPTVSRLLRVLERLSFRLADAVITTNPSYTRVTSERGCRPRRLVIAPNLPELEAFTPVPPDPSLKKGAEYLLVWVGTMGSQDGIDLAMAALGCLAGIRGDWRAVFAGQGEMLLPAQELVQSLGIADRVDFPGFQSRDAVRALISTADVCLAPDPKTRFNDLSTMIKVTEYLALGKPVVAFDLVETRRLAQDAAIYADDDSPLAFAQAIDLLLRDKERRDGMGARGSEIILETGGWRTSVERLTALYEELLSV